MFVSSVVLTFLILFVVSRIGYGSTPHIMNAKLLVVAGGGGGGMECRRDSCGGGGAGGFIYIDAFELSRNMTNYTVVVGVGGEEGTCWPHTGNCVQPCPIGYDCRWNGVCGFEGKPGFNSSFGVTNGLTRVAAAGGGGGGSYHTYDY